MTPFKPKNSSCKSCQFRVARERLTMRFRRRDCTAPERPRPAAGSAEGDGRTGYFAALAGLAEGAGAGIAFGMPVAAAAGTGALADAGAAGAAPGITAAFAGALADGAARSSTLPPPVRDGLARPSLDMKASASVHAKNRAAHAAVERDRKFALPLAPKRLPEEPLPKEAPMSAPLPCWISTRPIIVSAASS